jgi:hypothetical protein
MSDGVESNRVPAPVCEQTPGMLRRLAVSGETEMDQPDRLFRRASIRAGNPGHSKRKIGVS